MVDVDDTVYSWTCSWVICICKWTGWTLITTLPRWWRGGAIGRVSDLWLIGLGFEFCISTIVQWPWASYLHLCASVTKSKGGCLVTGEYRQNYGPCVGGR